MKTILSVIPMNDEQRARLESAAAGCRVIYSTEKTVTERDVQSAEIILGNVPAEFIHGSERLSLLQLASAGTDQYTPAGVLAPTTVLTNATGAYSKAVSEHMFAVMFSLIKKLHLYRDDQRERVWGDRGTVESITDMTVLVVGLGDIGLAFARMCSALGAYVIGVKRRGGECPDGVHELHLTQELDELRSRLAQEQEETEKADIQAEIDEIEARLADMEANEWLASPEGIAAYKRLAPYMTLGSAVSFLYGGSDQASATQELSNLLNRFIEGQMTAQQLVKELDKKIAMIYLEGN